MVIMAPTVLAGTFSPFFFNQRHQYVLQQWGCRGLEIMRCSLCDTFYVLLYHIYKYIYLENW